MHVSLSLQKGIHAFNNSVATDAANVSPDERNGFLIKWSNQAYAILTTIIGKHAALNKCLGVVALNRAQNLNVFTRAESGTYNREKSAVIEEVKRALPILRLAERDWVAHKLLKNRCSNAKQSRKKILKYKQRKNSAESDAGTDSLSQAAVTNKLYSGTQNIAGRNRKAVRGVQFTHTRPARVSQPVTRTPRSPKATEPRLKKK